MANHACTLLVLILLSTVGCGKLPLLSENRKNFPPWERLPDGGGITYLEKFTYDPGHDPIYLAKIEYQDSTDIQRFAKEFGLVPYTSLEQPHSFIGVLESPPIWFPLEKVTSHYFFPSEQEHYVANLWVNEVEKVMIIERSWW